MIPADTIERARNADVLAILARRGITLNSRRSWRWHCGPCAVCGGRDRFAVNPQKRAFSCRGCGASGGSAIDLVAFLDGLGAREDFRLIVERIIAEAKDDAPVDYEALDAADGEQGRKALWLWRRRRPIKGTIAETYLYTRGLTEALPQTLAFLPQGKRDQHPAMIAAFAIDADTPVSAVHLTLLAPDGSKAAIEHPKIVVGRPLGRPIILAPPNDTLALAITEGIEDGLSVHAATGLEVWAAGSAAFMPALADAIPDCIETVTIFAHDDKAGRNGALELAEKLTGLGVEVFIEGLA